MASRTPFEMVREFHEAFGLAVRTEPTELTDEEWRLRDSLICEEWSEFLSAWLHLGPALGDLRCDGLSFAAAAQEAADLIYVLCGAMLEMGVDLDAVFAEVHAANMRKLGWEGKPLRRADGKIMKPDDWRPADVRSIVFGR